ncbi:MAG: rane protein insertion efficiency factor YidD [Ramlibacter sp.]|jgi:putative membrane protein insertion efficiency factor|nr:rane protein insertion efficiency factor YidD [Ramlibacter sp.]MDB5913379.1 rane protein insertion efficiency factor YidD [Ramlibacter sp.]
MMRSLLIALVKGYRLLLSPWLGSACRFTPSCSAYSLEALTKHGAAAGSYLTLARLARCHPWCSGGHDPVPENPWTPTLRWPRKGPSASKGGLSMPPPRLFTRWADKTPEKKNP